MWPRQYFTAQNKKKNVTWTEVSAPISLPFTTGHIGSDREQTPQQYRSQLLPHMHREQSRTHRQAGEHWYRTGLQLHRTCSIKIGITRGPGLGCHMPGSCLKLSHSWQHTVCLRDTIQGFCWHHKT